MSVVLPAKEALEREWLSFEHPKPPVVNMADVLRRTQSTGVLTHVRMPDGQIVRPQDLPNIYGFSYDQWQLMRAELPAWPLRPEAMHVELGGIALTLDAFTAGHKHLELGQE